ncbi:unnamed protein product [Rhizoctonia solani]|uniref:Uncharacterized protein n=1 Tax=Rhizoctonia solani TaxID=456999 RepID=A0A8H2WNI0_9AGAM|nr:unnamed protein product [Rhizoctonia solani]
MRDVLVTVCAYFTQLRRLAVIDATEITSMKPVTLVNEGTIIVVSYTMNRQFPSREVHMIYDSRPVATRATLVAFHTTAVPAINNPLNPKASPKPPPSALGSTRLLLELSPPHRSKLFSKRNSRRISSQCRRRGTGGSAKLANNVDADEACVLGTAFHGSSLSRQLRTKPVKVQDAVFRTAYLRHIGRNKCENGNRRTTKTIPLPIRPQSASERPRL